MNTREKSSESHSSDADDTSDYQRRFITADGLSGACVPGINKSFVFESAYRTGVYHDDGSDSNLHELEAAVPSRILTTVFFKCLEQLDDVVDVIIENGHESSSTEWNSPEPFPSELFLREQLDKSTLLEMLASYELWLLFDGMSSITAFGSEAAGFRSPAEIKLRDDKVIYIVSDNFRDFEAILEAHGVPSNPQVTFVSDGAHIHYSSNTLEAMTEELISELRATKALREED